MGGGNKRNRRHRKRGPKKDRRRDQSGSGIKGPINASDVVKERKQETHSPSHNGPQTPSDIVRGNEKAPETQLQGPLTASQIIASQNSSTETSLVGPTPQSEIVTAASERSSAAQSSSTETSSGGPTPQSEIAVAASEQSSTTQSTRRKETKLGTGAFNEKVYSPEGVERKTEDIKQVRKEKITTQSGGEIDSTVYEFLSGSHTDLHVHTDKPNRGSARHTDRVGEVFEHKKQGAGPRMKKEMAKKFPKASTKKDEK